MKLIGFILRHIVPIVLIAGALLIVFNVANPPQPSRIEGLGVDLLSSPPLSAGAVEADLNAIQKAAVDYVSIEVNWTLIEITQDVYEWSSVIPLDMFFTSARSRGLKSIAVITGYPIYLSESESAVDEAAVGARWEKFIQAAVDHYGDQVDYWQIGDQINSTLASRALAQTDPGLYAKMLRSASRIIKRADSNDKVWMGSLVSATANNCAVNPLNFLMEMNAAKAWNSADAITYQPRRGAVLPESASPFTVNEACTSSMMINPATISTEIQSLQELVRQLGGKPVYITGFAWNADELLALQAGRSVDTNTLQSDLLVRGSTMLLGGNAIPLVLWQIDPVYEANTLTGLANLNTLIKEAELLGQIQGQSGNVQEYRFQKGAVLVLLAWRSQDGDAAQPVIFSNLPDSKLAAYAADSASFDEASGTPIQVDQTGNAVVMLNERPVIFTGKTGSWDVQIRAIAKNQIDLWRIELQDALIGWLTHLKALFIQWLENLFNQAKDSAVDWGENKIKDLLN